MINLIEQKIISLIDNKKGDLGRLSEMLERLRDGKSLYDSDIDYIEKLSPTTKSAIEHSQQSESIDDIEVPINMEKLRKSQPKPKPQKTKPIKFAVSYSNSRSGSAKIHNGGCHNVRRSSQEGDIKWNYFTNYPNAKQSAQQIGSHQPYGWKHAGCCMRNYPFNIIIGAIITTLFFGILGGLICWYFTRDHFGKTWAKSWLILGIITSLFWIRNI